VPTPRGATLDPGATTQRFIDGDDDAFASIYRALGARIFGMLLRLTRERALAEDLTQETFMRIYQARGSCRHDADLAPWAFTIARNLFRDHARRAHMRRSTLDGVLALEDMLWGATPTPDEDLAALQMANSVGEVLAGLPEKQLEAFHLVREDGYSLNEAAARLGRSEMAVRLAVHRARTAVRAHFADHWGVSV
jgi:RNA polymerase sigma-70 factor (ECF subfamily)